MIGGKSGIRPFPKGNPRPVFRFRSNANDGNELPRYAPAYFRQNKRGGFTPHQFSVCFSLVAIRKEWNTAVSQREPSAGFSLSLKCERRQRVAALRSRLFPPKQKGMLLASPFVLAERVGFEPTIRCRIPDFESGPL